MTVKVHLKLGKKSLTVGDVGKIASSLEFLSQQSLPLERRVITLTGPSGDKYFRGNFDDNVIYVIRDYSHLHEVFNNSPYRTQRYTQKQIDRLMNLNRAIN